MQPKLFSTNFEIENSVLWNQIDYEAAQKHGGFVSEVRNLIPNVILHVFSRQTESYRTCQADEREKQRRWETKERMIFSSRLALLFDVAI